MPKRDNKWESLILSKLASKDTFVLSEIIGPTLTDAEYQAVRKAMRTLGAAGTINFHHLAFGRRGHCRYWICREPLRAKNERK